MRKVVGQNVQRRCFGIGRAISITDLLVACVIVGSLSLRNFKYLLDVLQILMFVVCGKQLLKHVHKEYFVSTVLFVLWCTASYAWARDRGVILGSLVSVVQVSVICVFLSGYMTSKERIEKVIDYFVIAGIVLIINLLLSTSIAEWREIIFYSSGASVDTASPEGRLGFSVNMHPNAFGGVVTMCLICVVHRICCEKRARHLALGITLAGLLLLSKSRSSLIEVCFGIAAYYVFSARGIHKKMRRVGAGCILAICGILAILYVPALYKIIGYRMIGLLSGLLGGSADASTTGRLKLMIAGLEMFADYPILGVGLNNYAIVAHADYGIWRQVHAHNTFIEILSCLGLVGFVMYYGVRLRFIVQSWKIRVNPAIGCSTDYQLLAFLQTVGLMLLLSDVAHSTYSSECYQYMYLLAICMVSVMKKNAIK